MKPYPVIEFGTEEWASKIKRPFTGAIVIPSRSWYYIEGSSHRGLTDYTELDILKYLYKNDPRPELMALIMGLEQ